MTNILQRYRDPNCTGCKLHATAEHVCLLGDGAVPNRVMAIGEAPGKREDDSGKPFVGQSGEKLTQLAEAAGWNIRKEWFITNSVHCRPPDNRKPSKGEIKACAQWLKLEMEFVKPEWVILLGGTAVSAVLGKGHKISDTRGQVIERDGIKYFSTFHPSFILRDPRKEPVMLADLKKFRGLVDGAAKKGKLPGFNPIIVDSEATLRQLKRALLTHPWTSSDTETTGLDQFPKPDGDKPFGVVSLGFGFPGKQFVIPLYHPDINGKLFKPAHDIIAEIDPLVRDILIVGHNWKFDSLWMRRIYGVRWYAHHDNMIAAHLLNENRSIGLKELSMDLFGAMDYSLDFKKKSPYFYPLSQVLEYHALDLYYTAELYTYTKQQLALDSGLAKVFRYISMPLQRMLVDGEFKGVWVDKLKASRTLRDLQRVVAECDKELEAFSPGTNWNSPQQVAEILFDQLGYPVVEVTAGGANSVNESVLLRLKKEKPKKKIKINLIDLILKRREYNKNANDYVDKWMRLADEKDRIHPNFKITGAVTGRLSCDDPNLQATPRNPLIRQILGAPPGRVFISADLSQIELRIVAHVADVQEMKLCFINGIDIHKRTAMKMGLEEPTEEERKKAKAVNFGYVYGMWWKNYIIYARDNFGLDVDNQEAQTSREDFFELYPELNEYHKRQRNFARRNGYVRSLTGRKRRLPAAQYALDDPDKFKQAKRKDAERQAINAPIQGFASELNVMIALEVRKKFPESKLDVVGLVHDETLFECDEDIAQDVCRFIQKTSKWPPILSKFIERLSVPLEGGIKVGQWGIGEKWRENNGI